MIKGTTASGFAYEVSEDALNDYEILESLAELEENPLVFTTVAKRLLGAEQLKRLKDHIRNEKGIAPIDTMTAEVTEILTKSGESLKNS